MLQLSRPPAASAAFASPISLADSAVLVTPTSAPRDRAPAAGSLEVAEAAPVPLATATGAAAAAGEEADGVEALQAEPGPQAFPAQHLHASAQLPCQAAGQKRLRGVVTPLLCLLATIVAVAAALLLMPAGCSLMAPAGPSSGAAIFPQGRIWFVAPCLCSHCWCHPDPFEF